MQINNPSQRPLGHGSVILSADQRKIVSHGYQPAFIDVLEYNYPLKLLIPSHASSSPCKWIYPITYGGGLVEGDHIKMNVGVGKGCSALVTTQASTKVYHCPDGKDSQQNFQYNIGSDALLAILPDPVVPFENSRYSQSQSILMNSDSNLILLDWTTAGRVARKEVWDFDRVFCSYTISVDGKIVVRDGLKLQDSPHLALKEAMAQYMVTGSLVLLGPALKSLCRECIQNQGKPKSISDTYNCEKLLAVSPLDFKSHGINMEGCILRFSYHSVSGAYEDISSLLESMNSTFGGNPFENKF